MGRGRKVKGLEVLGYLMYLLLCLAVLGGVGWIIWRLRYQGGGR